MPRVFVRWGRRRSGAVSPATDAFEGTGARWLNVCARACAQATSALDAAAEAAVVEALRRCSGGGRATVVIAHGGLAHAAGFATQRATLVPHAGGPGAGGAALVASE